MRVEFLKLISIPARFISVALTASKHWFPLVLKSEKKQTCLFLISHICGIVK